MAWTGPLDVAQVLGSQVGRPTIRIMIFAFATDDRTLLAFQSESEAIAYAEGVDVEDGVWLFFKSWAIVG
jgi:hypothetical protein